MANPAQHVGPATESMGGAVFSGNTVASGVSSGRKFTVIKPDFESIPHLTDGQKASRDKSASRIDLVRTAGFVASFVLFVGAISLAGATYYMVKTHSPLIGKLAIAISATAGCGSLIAMSMIHVNSKSAEAQKMISEMDVEVGLDVLKNVELARKLESVKKASLKPSTTKGNDADILTKREEAQIEHAENVVKNFLEYWIENADKKSLEELTVDELWSIRSTAKKSGYDLSKASQNFKDAYRKDRRNSSNNGAGAAAEMAATVGFLALFAI